MMFTGAYSSLRSATKNATSATGEPPDLSNSEKGGEIFQKVNEIFQNGAAVFQKVGAV